MPFSDVRSRIIIDPDFGTSTVSVNSIMSYIENAYNSSTVFAKDLNSFTGSIYIDYVVGKAEATVHSGLVRIDPMLMKEWAYLSKYGTAYSYSFPSVLIHEISHAVTNYGDNISNTDLSGDNVRHVNQIFTQLGIPELASYIGTDVNKSVIEIGKDYTNESSIGDFVDNAIISMETYFVDGYQVDTLNIDRRGVQQRVRDLGSRLIHSQNARAVARATPDRKLAASLS